MVWGCSLFFRWESVPYEEREGGTSIRTDHISLKDRCFNGCCFSGACHRIVQAGESEGQVLEKLHPDVIKLLKALLPVLDNLERAVESGQGTEDPFIEGVRGIHRQISDLLYQYDCRGFTSVGTPFDPTRHEAMGQVHSAQTPANQVAEEMRRGYFLGDNLLRPAQVLVSTGEEKTAEAVSDDPKTLPAKPETSQPRAKRSAVNRPLWVLNPPEDTSSTAYFVGRARAARTADDGTAEAAASALPALFERIPALFPDHSLKDLYSRLARTFQPNATARTWANLKKLEPKLEAWIEDVFWHQVTSEISGTVYDVAVLLAVKTEGLDELLTRHGQPERWSRITFVETGPFVQAVLDGRQGALVAYASTGGGGHSLLQAGDVIIKVGLESTPNAATARRILTRLGRGRRTFQLEFLRDLQEMNTVRVGGRGVLR